jgi:hypothetical protein
MEMAALVVRDGVAGTGGTPHPGILVLFVFGD